MKKITFLLLFIICSFSAYSQFFEDFESSTDLPAGWDKYSNGTGTSKLWTINTSGACQGSKAAFVDREFIGQGVTEEDYLITPSILIPVNGQLKFSSRQGIPGDQGTRYKLLLSTNSDKTLLSAYTLIREWRENEMNATYNVCQDQNVDLKWYGGQQVYLAFVRIYTQPEANINGDKWYLDNINVLSRCFEPTKGLATNIRATEATLSWSDNKATSWDLEVLPAGLLPIGIPTDLNVTNSYHKTGLNPDTAYCYYIRSNCPFSTSDWSGPFCFETALIGTYCTDPIAISTLPFQQSANSANYKDLLDGPLGSNCGGVPATTDYMGGNDIFYSYKATESGFISIKMTPFGANTGVFVYGSCPGSGTAPACLTGVANNNSEVRFINNFPVTAGNTYTIVISSSAVTQTVSHSFEIQKANCNPPVGSVPTAITKTTADLSWNNPTSATHWEVEVQPLGSAIPAGEGKIKVDINPFSTVTDLISGTQYQYYVRSECTSGVFSSWAGPYAFNTVICDDTDKCHYTFSMTDTANNGWNGATMQVRQNGIVVATIGSTFTSGSGPVNITVPLCKNVPFDLFWDTAGLNPSQCVVSVINKFSQTIFTKEATQGATGLVVYNDVVNCDSPICNIKVTGLAAKAVTTKGADLSWNAPSTETWGWGVYVVPEGSPAPDVTTSPNYPVVTANPSLTISDLLADTSYDFYVRVHCDIVAVWSAPFTFKTFPSCPQPTALTVEAITTTGATFNWINGSAADSKWEIYMIKAVAPSYGVPPAPPLNPFLTAEDKFYPITASSPFITNDLDPASIYYYYIRTVCSDTDKSIWSGPIKFNTSTCLTTDSCAYKFILTDSGKDGWNGGRIQVRQNGIVVATLGTTISGAGPNTVTVKLCNEVPFDLYWTLSGTKPEEIGVKIQNPFTDILFTKSAGEGSIGTVLFSSTANCIKPICSKPTDLTVVSVSTNSATLSWTENAVPGATQWEVYVVPTGSVPPVNGTPVSGIPPYYITKQNENPLTVTGLLPATTYDCYVRSLCSGSDISTWTIINSATFTTTSLFDECTTAISVGVNPTSDCLVKASGTTLGATASLPLTLPVCSGNSSDDIWFSFVAISDMHLININNIGGSTTALNHTLYSGTDCGYLTQMYCSDLNMSIASGLIPGNTYKIRVYTKGLDKTQTATFDVCITTPPNIINDDCNAAMDLPVNEEIDSIAFKDVSLTKATGSAVANTCLGIADDDVWFKFVAKAEKHYITISNIVGSTQNIIYSVFSGECNNLMPFYCHAGNAKVVIDNYIKGQTYYVRIWSNEPVRQDARFKICINSIYPPITTDGDLYTDKQLVEEVLLGTKCASVTNVTSRTGTNYPVIPSEPYINGQYPTENTNGIGYFTKNGSTFPFKDGIVLTSGNVRLVPGPNNQRRSDGNPLWLGDEDMDSYLQNYAGEKNLSVNASVLEFDFIPLSNKISFNFIFASEEYGPFQCNFGDGFVFLLTNKLSNVTTNLAVLPNTDVPISCLTIRDSAFNIGESIEYNCDSVNPEYFADCYNWNGTFPHEPQYGFYQFGSPISYNGFTIPMTASSTVFAGVPYHIKLVVSDMQMDSTSFNFDDAAVFLEGGSFNLGKADLGTDLLVKTGNAVCMDDTHTINSGLSTDYFLFKWKKDGKFIDNEVGPTLIINAPGIYTLEATYKNTNCTESDAITVEFYQDSAPGKPKDLLICSSSNVGTFDLTQNTTRILGPYSANDHTVSYFKSFADANANTNVIQTPNAFENKTNPQTIYARVDNTGTKCHQVVDFVVKLEDFSPVFAVTGKTELCPSESSVLTVVPTSNSYDPTSVGYRWTFNGEVIPNATTASLQLNGSASYGNYTVTVNNSDCTNSQDIIVSQNTKPIQILIEKGCSSNDYQLIANPVDGSFNPATVAYEWKELNSADILSTKNSITLKKVGTYIVKVSTSDGCSSEIKTIVENISCYIQKGISPDGDGKNDNFDLTTLNISRLEIFNRWGTEVFSMDNYHNEWHGQSKDGANLPDATYFYEIHFIDHKTKTGWIYISRKK